MPKLKIELEQHTPIIHFQADQKGATLRATELKPKLDKYIYNNYKNKEELKNYTIRETNSLNYKLKITDIDVMYKDIGNIKNKNSYHCFFGNMKSEDDEEKDKPLKKFVGSESLELEFFSYNENLIQVIAVILPAFLRENNFGMRQSKGFGNFYINKDQNYYIDDVEKKYINELLEFDKSWYRFEINSINENVIFKNIELFYKTLRSGINSVNRDKESTFYFKSLIATYAYINGIQWEKKTIKENFADNSINENDKGDGKEKRIVKDIMGLSSIEKWNKKTILKNSDNIERFKSPIIFKPIKGKKSCIVYFKAFEYNKDILNHEFEINIVKDKTIKLKTIDGFDFNDFFEYAFNINLYDYMKMHSGEKFKEYIKEDTYEDIEKIYKSINKFKQEVK